MKKIIRIFSIISILVMIILTGNVYAASLSTLDIQVSKTTVRPGEEVTVTVQFGEALGAYTVNVAYDNNLFDYISSEGGTPNDTGDKIKVVYFDNSGGSNPRASMSVTFKAKEGITTSNPTDFAITLEGLSNQDASVTFDDIMTPIIKNVVVSPEFIDYTLKLEYIGDIIKDEEKEMKISYSSPAGKYYAHARLLAIATAPDGASVQLIARDNNGIEHDIIDSGWGDASGFEIGGENFAQILQTRAIFSEIGNYTIKLELIDRDNSDAVIAERDFQIAVGETVVEPPVVTPEIQSLENSEPIGNAEATPNTESIPNVETPVQVSTENVQSSSEQMPKTLPKTGINMYFVLSIFLILIGLVGGYIYYNREK